MKCICEIFEKYLQEYVNPIICVPEDLSKAPILGKYGRPLDGKSDKVFKKVCATLGQKYWGPYKKPFSGFWGYFLEDWDRALKFSG